MTEFKLPNAAAHNLTISTTAVDLQTAITAAAGEDYTPDNNVDSVLLIAETNEIRVLSDGNTPTASNGLLIDADGNIKGAFLKGVNPSKVKLIRADAADASVYVGLFKNN